MNNLAIWEKVRSAPKDALKEIKGGRMAGKSDINPVWRMKALTELFGPCGIGWRYEITEKRLETGANGEMAAFVDVNLFVKHEGAWSEAIPGTGGNIFIAKEAAGLRTSDECFKMALTDAISVSCKALGVAADVYWAQDPTKYDRQPDAAPGTPPALDMATETQIVAIVKLAKETGMVEAMRGLMQERYSKNRKEDLTKAEAKNLLDYLREVKSA